MARKGKERGNESEVKDGEGKGRRGKGWTMKGGKYTNKEKEENVMDGKFLRNWRGKSKFLEMEEE